MSDTRKRAASLPATPSVTRRSVLLAAGGAAALVACGDDGGNEGGEDAAPTGETEDQEPADTPADSPPAPEDSDTGDSGGGDTFASVSDVPVGSGSYFADQEVVVVQPEEGEFKAYAGTCTHQGCPLDEFADGEILCSTSCGHGSVFSVADGSVVQGPASAPLEEVNISVDGDDIALS